MNICYLTHDLNLKAGYGRYSSDLILGAKNAGHNVTILVEDNSHGGEKIIGRGSKVLFSAKKARSFFKQCDIIHALDGYPFGIVATLGNIQIKKPLIITAVGTYAVAPLYNWKSSWLLCWAYKQADVVAAISSYTASEIKNRVPGVKSTIINPGVDIKKFLKPHIESSENFILSVGALKHRKGYHISIPAFAQVKKKNKDLRYKIVGNQSDINYFNNLKKLARQYGVEDDIDFLSGISDEELGNLYQRANLFILTSINHNHHFEGFGLVFLEAAAAGLPVIGTSGNGIEDAVNNEVNGLLVSQKDIEATSEAIITIVSDKQRWKNMSDESVAWAKRHSRDKVASQYLKVYSDILND